MLFQELSVVEKHVFLKLFLNILTQNVLFMLDVEKEEMKWLKYLKNFHLYLLQMMMVTNKVL